MRFRIFKRKTKYAIEWYAARSASLTNPNETIHVWVSTGWIRPESAEETNLDLAERRLASARERNPEDIFRLVEAKD